MYMLGAVMELLKKCCVQQSYADDRICMAKVECILKTDMVAVILATRVTEIVS